MYHNIQNTLNIYIEQPFNSPFVLDCTRLINWIDKFFHSIILLRYLADRPGYEIAKKYFGDDLPDLDTLRSRMSLILTNGHKAVSTPRALAPGYKELGGMHIPASGPSPLPKDLKDFLDSSENGVIYFSLGSQINMSTMPNEVLMSFYEAFERIPQRILWKCTENNMPRLPKKVKCIEWAPQLSILCTYIRSFSFFFCVCACMWRVA